MQTRNCITTAPDGTPHRQEDSSPKTPSALTVALACTPMYGTSERLHEIKKAAGRGPADMVEYAVV